MANSKVQKKINKEQVISSLTAVYSCKLITDNSKLYKIGDDLKHSASISRKGDVKTEKEDDSVGNVSNKTRSCFDMTFGYFNVEKNKDGFEDYVSFPFLDSFEITVLSIGSMSGIIPDNFRLKNTQIKDDNNVNGSDAGTSSISRKLNCTVKFNFKIPAQLRREPDKELVFQNLILSQYITSESLIIRYISSPFVEGDDDRLAIFDLRVIDFGEGFNPINSSNGYEELSFSRLFSGYLAPNKEKVKLLKLQEKKEFEKSKLEHEIEFEEQSMAKEKKYLNDSKGDVSKKQAAVNIFNLENSIKRKKSALKEMIESGGVSRKGEQLLDYEKTSKHYNDPIKVTFVPDETIDFKNIWYAEDTSTDSSGILQLSVVNEYIHERQYMEHGNYGLFTLKPIIKDKFTTESGKKVNIDKNLKSINNTMTSKANSTSIINKESDKARNDFSKANKSFTLNVVLPRAILHLEVYDLIELRNSVFGVYDGFWRVMKNNLIYDTNGQIRQEISLTVDKIFKEKYDKKTNVKVVQHNMEVDILDMKIEETRKQIEEELGEDVAEQTPEQLMEDLELFGDYN